MSCAQKKKKERKKKQPESCMAILVVDRNACQNDNIHASTYIQAMRCTYKQKKNNGRGLSLAYFELHELHHAGVQLNGGTIQFATAYGATAYGTARRGLAKRNALECSVRGGYPCLDWKR